MLRKLFLSFVILFLVSFMLGGVGGAAKAQEMAIPVPIDLGDNWNYYFGPGFEKYIVHLWGYNTDGKTAYIVCYSRQCVNPDADGNCPSPAVFADYQCSFFHDPLKIIQCGSQTRGAFTSWWRWVEESGYFGINLPQDYLMDLWSYNNLISLWDTGVATMADGTPIPLWNSPEFLGLVHYMVTASTAKVFYGLDPATATPNPECMAHLSGAIYDNWYNDLPKNIANCPPDTVTGVKRPRDIIAEGFMTEDPDFAALEQRVYCVEFAAPLTDYEKNGAYGVVPPAIVASADSNGDGKTQLRGWYIVGDGITGKNRSHPLIIIQTGATGAIEYHIKTNDYMYVSLIECLVKQGFDVLFLDKRGEGFSEGIYAVPGSDVFACLNQLEAGCWTYGPHDEAAVWRGHSPAPDGSKKGKSLLGKNSGEEYTAKTKPVVLLGHSMGAMLAEKAMAININPQLVKQEMADLDPSNFTGYNFRAVITLGAPSGCNYFSFMDEEEFALALYGGWYKLGIPGRPVKDVYDTIDQWPGYMFVQGAFDQWFSADGLVSAYNKARGFKQIVLLPATHNFETINGICVGGECKNTFFKYAWPKVIDFAKQCVLSNAPMNNSATTTLEQEVCNAPSYEELLNYPSMECGAEKPGKGLGNGIPGAREIPDNFLSNLSPENRAKLNVFRNQSLEELRNKLSK